MSVPTGKEIGEFLHPLISPKCRTCVYMRNGLVAILGLYEVGRVSLDEKLKEMEGKGNG